MIKKRRWLFFIGAIFILGITSNHWRVKEVFYKVYFDIKNENKTIESKEEILKVLKSFDRVEFQDLDEEYKTYTKSKSAKYYKLLSEKRYYQIKRKDFFKHIVGTIRINELIAKDKYYKYCLSNKEANYNWLISEELLFKLLELQIKLNKAGYNSTGFTITNGHRHPKYNESVSGASLSRHIRREAIDIHINDIDKNGRYEETDKEIVLQLLENHIIKSTGGIGRYPGTRAVHFDVRGYRARWDKQ